MKRKVLFFCLVYAAWWIGSIVYVKWIGSSGLIISKQKKKILAPLQLQSNEILTSITKFNNDSKIISTTTKEKILDKYRKRYEYYTPNSSNIGSYDTDNKGIIVNPTCGSSPDFYDFFSLSKINRSGRKEDCRIYERFFKDAWESNEFKGTFVELGGFDGMRESNSRFFEHCLGWEGLLIEGNPDNYRRMVLNRPLAHRMSFAPSCNHDGENVTFSQRAGTDSGLPGYAFHDKGRNIISVPCGPLTPVLEGVFGQNPHINFFSLDVEGSEDLVLSTIDFDRVKIDVFLIEVMNRNCQDKCELREKVRERMKKNGYIMKRIFVPGSDVYFHPNSTFQLKEI